MWKFLFAPLHPWFRVTPLTCATALLCAAVGARALFSHDDVYEAVKTAVLFSAVATVINVALHEDNRGSR